MRVFEERLIQEYDELTERIEKLDKFLNIVPKGVDISDNMRFHMSGQLNAMHTYHYHLEKRMELLDLLKYSQNKNLKK